MTESRLRRRGAKRRGATGATPGEAAAAGEKADAYLPVDLVPLLLYLNLEKEELGHVAAGEEDHPTAAPQQPLIRRSCVAPAPLWNFFLFYIFLSSFLQKYMVRKKFAKLYI
jgi:hypothetical protein